LGGVVTLDISARLGGGARSEDSLSDIAPLADQSASGLGLVSASERENWGKAKGKRIEKGPSFSASPDKRGRSGLPSDPQAHLHCSSRGRDRKEDD